MPHVLAHDETRDRIAVSDLLSALGDRALAALLFAFAVPNVLPVPPGTPASLAAPRSSLRHNRPSAAGPGSRP